MPSNFKFNNGGDYADFDDVFIRRDIFSTGDMYGWGNDGYGQLGDGSIVSKSSPVQVNTQLTWKQLSCGASSTYGIKPDGTLWAWGSNDYGQLGLNDANHRSSPVQVGSLSNWQQVSCTATTVGAIKTDGTLWTWGYGYFGQIGNGTTGINWSSPVQVGTLSNWKQVSAGSVHMAAVKTDGTLWAWGQNDKGQLGDNTIADRANPTQEITASTAWKQVACSSSGTGAAFTIAIKTDNTMWSWGSNSYGQLGQAVVGGGYSRSPGVTYLGTADWKTVSCGSEYATAIKTSGTLWTWGSNSSGKLGLGTQVNVYETAPKQVGLLTNWKQSSAGVVSTSAIKTDGTIWSWGQNSDGQLGVGSTTWTSSPVQIGSLTNWKQVSVGTNYTAAITDNL